LVPPAWCGEARVDHHRVSAERLQDRDARAHLGDERPGDRALVPGP
jgi:hypothetical protein